MENQDLAAAAVGDVTKGLIAQVCFSQQFLQKQARKKSSRADSMRSPGGHRITAQDAAAAAPSQSTLVK